MAGTVGGAKAAGGQTGAKDTGRDPVRDVVVVGLSFLTLVIVLIIVIIRFGDSKDVTSVLGVVIPVISTIGAAAFGISAGKATGDAGKKAAEAELDSSKKETGAKASALEAKIDTLENAFAPTADTVRLLPSPAGQRFHRLTANETPGVDISFDPEDLDTVRETIASMRAGVQDLKV